MLDQDVLDLLADVHREDFMPAAYRRVALADVGIPIGHGEITMTPKAEARLLQSLLLDATDKVLEIGTGCGYLTALLGRSAQSVISVDIHEDFTRTAGGRLAEHGIHNVRLETGDAVNGWPGQAPYDAIAVTGSVPVLTESFQSQLAVGGRLFVIVGESPVMEARLITRIGEREWSSESLFETDLPPLVGAPRRQHFTL
ncbi:MAG: protein-L-isoaspartate O-methyltransferase [Gammaproteobacteria bacterium]|nr:protein-L-isoaspartate O-methyltransferase [Gammaproteobacteria bacterium]